LGDDIFATLRHDAGEDASPFTVAAGVIIDPSGIVLTQYLAVLEGEAHSVTTIEGKTYAATLRAADPRSGLAVLAIDPRGTASSSRRTGNADSALRSSFPFLRFGDASQLRKGQFVIALGNPYAIGSDGQPTASWGIITNLARKAPAETNFNNAPGPLGDFRTTLHHLGTLIQTDAKLGWSAGGGALVNLKGELVGVTTTAATIAGHEQPAGYAIPINSTFRRIIDTLKEGREVEYGMLGVTFGVGSQTPAQASSLSRVAVGQVFSGSPAARAGLQNDDILMRVGDRTVNDFDSLQLAVSSLPPATTTTIEYERDGRSNTTRVTLAKLAVAGKVIVSVRPESWHGINVDYATALEAASLARAIESGAFDPEGCVLVSDVEPESEAWRAGMRAGMFISHVGGQRVATPGEFRTAVGNVTAILDIRLTQPVAPPAEEAGRRGNNPVDTNRQR
jgi:S1-C subfamily serine protease